MKRTVWAWIATTIWVGSWAAYAWLEWARVVGLSPNELGDFLAGITAPVAFFWLVVGYFQQGEELRQNTEALKQQEDALKQQVEESRNLVRVTSEQAHSTIESQIFERDRELRELQPLFTVEQIRTTSGVLEIRLNNQGNVAHDVRFVAHGHFAITIDSLMLWKTKEIVSFNLDASPKHKTEGRIGELLIFYRDDMGLSQRQVFRVAWSGGLPKLTHAPRERLNQSSGDLYKRFQGSE